MHNAVNVSTGFLHEMREAGIRGTTLEMNCGSAAKLVLRGPLKDCDLPCCLINVACRLCDGAVSRADLNTGMRRSVCSRDRASLKPSHWHSY